MEQRISLNQIYASDLTADVQLPGGCQTWHLNLRVNNKQHILDKIFTSGLFSSSHDASLAYVMEDGTAPQAEALAEGVINLFNDHHFTIDEAEWVGNFILENLP